MADNKSQQKALSLQLVEHQNEDDQSLGKESLQESESRARDFGYSRSQPRMKQKIGLIKESQNEHLIAEQTRRIKSHLLSPREKSYKVMKAKMNSFKTIDLQQVKHLDVQKNRIETQVQLQELYNRVLLLEKEEKRANLNVQLIQKQTERILHSKQLQQEKQQLYDQVRTSREQTQEERQLAKNSNKLHLHLSLQISLSNSQQITKNKAEQMKQIHQRMKQQLNANNEHLILQNKGQFNSTRFFEKQQKYYRLASMEQRQQLALRHRCQQANKEESIFQQKQDEYNQLEEQERLILQSLKSTQTLFSHAKADMHKVIAVKNNEVITQNEIKSKPFTHSFNPFLSSKRTLHTHVHSLQNFNLNHNVKLTQFPFPSQPLQIDHALNLSTSHPLKSPTNGQIPFIRSHLFCENNNHNISITNHKNAVTSSSIITEHNPGEFLTTREDVIYPNQKILPTDDDQEEDLQIKSSHIYKESSIPITQVQINYSRKQSSNFIDKREPVSSNKHLKLIKYPLSSPPKKLRPTTTTSIFTNNRSSNLSLVCPPSNFQAISLMPKSSYKFQ